jgi:diguanylate cyclase (GGDEF)-like protein
MFARFGGEEFCLIIEDASLESAASVAEKIRKEVYDLDIEHKESDYKKVTISIGVVSIEDTSKISIYEMIENADEALYKAKQKGRNSVVVSTLSK